MTLPPRRYDAAQYIDLDCDAVDNSEYLDAIVERWNDNNPDDTVTRDLVCTNYWAAIKLPELRQLVGNLLSLLPKAPGSDTDRIVDEVEVGAFDFDSIMMYGSFAGGRDEDTPTMKKRSDGSTWEDEDTDTISAGDGKLS